MQIQPMPAPLATSGPQAAGATQGTSPTAKAETPRPVDATHKDPPPRFPYPKPDQEHAIDIEV